MNFKPTIQKILISITIILAGFLLLGFVRCDGTCKFDSSVLQDVCADLKYKNISESEKWDLITQLCEREMDDWEDCRPIHDDRIIPKQVDKALKNNEQYNFYINYPENCEYKCRDVSSCDYLKFFPIIFGILTYLIYSSFDKKNRK